MTDLRTAAQQALAFTMRDFASLRDFEAAKAVLHDNLRAALAQQDEPVAWIESPHGAIRANPNYKFTFPSQLLHWRIPLYTAPPQRKPLTEEEIRRIIACIDKFTPVREGMRQLAHAIERAHGIGEQS